MDEFVQEILEIIKSNKSVKEKKELLQDYHENDIADVLPYLTEDEKNTLFKLLSKDDLSEVISYADDAENILEKLDDEKAADILEEMDADDAVDILENLDEKERDNLLDKMDEDAAEDAKLILSYEDDQIGRLMTTNYIVIKNTDNIQSAMKKLIEQSAENDNISTIFVVDNKEKYLGAIDLKDLIRARKEASIDDILVPNYPSVKASAVSSEVYHDVIDYGEDIIPVLDDNDHLIGALTAHDLVEMVGDEMQDDYQKFAAINGNVDLDSSVFASVKKRAPWLMLLLFLGFVVSMLLSRFETVISTLTTMVLFQSVILDMAGNAGTQSLAVTIRIMSEEEIDNKLIAKMFFKEIRVGITNGLILGVIAFGASLLYLFILNLGLTSGDTFSSQCVLVSGIIGLSLFLAMTLSSLIGSVIPVFFHMIHVDPAVASGPLITTLNDLVAVTVYYGTCLLLLMPLVG